MNRLSFSKFTEIETLRKELKLTKTRMAEIIGVTKNRYHRMSIGMALLTKDHFIEFSLKINSYLNSDK